MKSYRITFFSNGMLQKKDIQMQSWYDFISAIQSLGINEWEIMNVELLPIDD